ncbi:MAG: hypothetical protein ACI4VC_00530 [Clostridia bacterium]
MRNTTKANILTIIFLLFIGILVNLSFIRCSNYIDSKNYITNNNSARDYKFEHYCDSIYEVNPDYYLDVLIETDKFQDYIDKHGKWWKN